MESFIPRGENMKLEFRTIKEIIRSSNTAAKSGDSEGRDMARQSVYDMKVSKIYSALLQKAERKGRTREELDAVITWLTGYDMAKVDQDMTYGEFFGNAPMINPRAALIKGKVCGIDVESVEDPLMRKIRWLDKLVDELAKGRPLEKILR